MQVDLLKIVESAEFCWNSSSQVVVIEVKGDQVRQQSYLGGDLALELVTVKVQFVYEQVNVS